MLVLFTPELVSHRKLDILFLMGISLVFLAPGSTFAVGEYIEYDIIADYHLSLLDTYIFYGDTLAGEEYLILDEYSTVLSDYITLLAEYILYYDELSAYESFEYTIQLDEDIILLKVYVTLLDGYIFDDYRGHFVPVYRPDYVSYYGVGTWLYDIDFLEAEADWLNETFYLPYDVIIAASECGEENAFYNSYYKMVILCYELVDHLFDIYYEFNGDNESCFDIIYDGTVEEVCESATDFVFANVYAALYHEMGHAVLGIYNLPYTGLEENVADQFSGLVLSRTEGGYDMMHNVAKYWQYSSESSEPIPWDTHAGDLQRFYNISCYVYGADTYYNAFLVEDGLLPEDRAVWCEEEYEQISYAFGHLLYDYNNGFFNHIP